ncbi:MAG TPA: carbon monoxide dehydrogenase subunit G [Pseudomonadales bacterium]
MEQFGEYRISAARAMVWEGLNDPDVLGRCIQGCLSMERTSDEQFDASVKAKVGPVSATFQAQLMLSEIDAPSSYTLTANVKGGAAGFGKGTAKVSLLEDGASTLLRYQVSANVGGKLAQVGSRLIDAAARKMADDFFAEFGREVGGAEPEALAAVAEAPVAGGRWKIWVAVAAIVVIILLLMV